MLSHLSSYLYIIDQTLLYIPHDLMLIGKNLSQGLCPTLEVQFVGLDGA